MDAHVNRNRVGESVAEMHGSSQAEVLDLDTRDARVQRMKRHVLTTSRLVLQNHQRLGQRRKMAMLTLTYRDDTPWAANHVAKLLNVMRTWCARKGVSIPYVWVAELTKRGRMHYHILLSMPKGLTLPKPDKQGWWPHGMTRIEWVRSAVGYLAKYASKGDGSSAFPKGARICGSGGLEPLVRIARTWLHLPRHLRAISQPEHLIARRVGGGHLCRATGQTIPPAYGLIAAACHRVRLVRLAWQPPLLPALLRFVPSEWLAIEAAGTRGGECG
jgi:hypothetical protein